MGGTVGRFPPRRLVPRLTQMSLAPRESSKYSTETNRKLAPRETRRTGSPKDFCFNKAKINSQRCGSCCDRLTPNAVLPCSRTACYICSDVCSHFYSDGWSKHCLPSGLLSRFLETYKHAIISLPTRLVCSRKPYLYVRPLPLFAPYNREFLATFKNGNN